MINVYLPGTKVKTVSGNHEALILQSSIVSPEYIQYQIGYFYDGDYKTYWVSEFEFSTDESKTQIGFKK